MGYNTPSDPFATGPFVIYPPGTPSVVTSATSLDASGNVVTLVSTTMAEEANAHTIQSLIEVSYIGTANRILSDGLEQLDEALSITDDALNVLTNLQNLHNTVTVTSLSALPFDFTETGDDVDDYMEKYSELASSYFGLPIFPDFIFITEDTENVGGFSDFEAMRDQLYSYKQDLADVISNLSAVTPAATLNDPNSLYQRLQTVLEQLPPGSSSSPGSYEQVKLWALDGYTIHEGVDHAQSSPDNIASANDLQYPRFSAVSGEGPLLGERINPVDNSGNLSNPIGSIVYSGLPAFGDGVNAGNESDRNNAAAAGAIQQSITFAITAAQSLNDTQKEEVRRFMFVFEEYYKSAGAILSKITQIIEKIAQGIRPA